jgi:parallel beta-helix repeat protein
VITSSGTAEAPITIEAYPGESPVIDGKGTLPLKLKQPLVLLRGRYIHMDGFEVRNHDRAGSGGVVVDGDHNVLSHMNVHHHSEAGVLARGDYTIVEDSRVWENAYRNCRRANCPASPYPNGGWATGLSAARNPIGGITDHAILRRNIVYDNWGEGLSAYESRSITLEDNTVYDNWAVNIYVSDTSGTLVQRNVVYNTNETEVGRQRPCLQLSDERADKPSSHDNTIINNVCLNAAIYAFSWTGVPGSGMVNDLIANNTVVNGWIELGDSHDKLVVTHRNTRIVNNIFLSEGKVATAPTVEGVLFSNNLWSKDPGRFALGIHSVVADPKLLGKGSTRRGELTREYFALGSHSPACGAGLDLGTSVQDDIFLRPRSATPCIGASEGGIPTHATGR